MTNQNILKAFNILFTYPIWRIEIDAEKRLIAVETRNPADTLPYFNVVTFDGDYILRDFEAIGKEWVLAGIQCQKLILKKISSNSPIEAGIHLIDCDQPEQQETWFNYLFLEMVHGGIRIRPKMVEQGMQLFLDLKTGSIENKKEDSFKPFDGKIVYPVIYNGQVPKFLTGFTIAEEIWINALEDHFIWAFYEKNTDNHYQIRIVRSTRERLIDAVIAVDQLPLKLFNIYFLANKQIFLLTDNKREFVSYLV